MMSDSSAGDNVTYIVMDCEKCKTPFAQPPHPATGKPKRKICPLCAYALDRELESGAARDNAGIYHST
jgi:hypothetical protein